MKLSELNTEGLKENRMELERLLELAGVQTKEELTEAVSMATLDRFIKKLEKFSKWEQGEARFYNGGLSPKRKKMLQRIIDDAKTIQL